MNSESNQTDIRARSSVSLAGERWVGEVYIESDGAPKPLARLFFVDFDAAKNWADDMAKAFNKPEEENSLLSVFSRTTSLHRMPS